MLDFFFLMKEKNIFLNKALSQFREIWNTKHLRNIIKNFKNNNEKLKLIEKSQDKDTELNLKKKRKKSENT